MAAVAEPASLCFRAMGSPCRVVVESSRTDLALGVRNLVDDLERRWSRFRADSEVSALNRAAGRPTIVSAATYALVAAAVRARELTGGRFNPLMLAQLEANGYRRPWGEATPQPTTEPIEPGTELPITLYPEANAVQLPEGARFDPGGIGKGLAVDRAIEWCRSAGSDFASVELGGDLRVYGRPWYGDRWVVGVADPFRPSADIATLTPTEGAVTTSTTAKRRWFDGRRWRHHLLDPSTGGPADTDLVTVTTCSSEAWWAEVAAKTGLMAGSAGVADALHRSGTPGVAVTTSGRVVTVDPAPGVEVVPV